jgi:hypothetical protein
VFVGSGHMLKTLDKTPEWTIQRNW